MRTPFALALTGALALGAVTLTGPAPAPATAAALALAGPSGGAKHELGSITVSGYTFTVTQESAVTPGKEADFSLVKTAGEGDPKAVRLWVGIESAEGSTKVRTHKHGDKMEAHVEVPDPIPAGAKLWVEVETAAGRKAASLDFKK